MAPAPRVRFYRNIVATFVLLNIVLLVFVVYLSFVQAKITIISKRVPVTANFIADAVTKPTKTGEITGLVVSQNFEKTKKFSVTGGADIPGKASGTVTISNTTSGSQTLVKTTRVLSKDGVLFRLTKQVVIPAHGATDAVVEADVTGAGGNIAPTTFTIPGLPSSQQTKIYAESKAEMTGGVKHVASVSQSDLDAAVDELAKDVKADADVELSKSEPSALSGKVISYEILEKKSDTAPGTEASEFTVSVKLRVAGVFYDQAALSALAKAKLFESLSGDLQLENVDPSDLSVTVDKFDVKTNIANLKVVATGTAKIKEGGSIVNKDRILGLSVSEATAYFRSHDEVEDVKITIQPFWVKTLPKLKDHIEIVIQ